MAVSKIKFSSKQQTFLPLDLAKVDWTKVYTAIDVYFNNSNIRRFLIYGMKSEYGGDTKLFDRPV